MPRHLPFLPWLLLALLSFSKLSLGPRVVGLGLGSPKRPPLGALEGGLPPLPLPLSVVLMFYLMLLKGVVGFYFSHIFLM